VEIRQKQSGATVDRPTAEVVGLKKQLYLTGIKLSKLKNSGPRVEFATNRYQDPKEHLILA
jgi:hypothetical protein